MQIGPEERYVMEEARVAQEPVDRVFLCEMLIGLLGLQETYS